MCSPSESRILSYCQAINEATDLAMQTDPSVFLMGLDVDDHKGIQGSTLGLVDKYGAERVFTTPLSEDAMTGMAIGAAMAGMRPIHVHIRMDFLMLCMNQLINIAAKSHYMYGGAVNVPIVVRTIIGKSWGQGAQHSQALHSMFMHVPGIKVLAPSNAFDAKGLLLAAIKDNNPVVFMEHRLLYQSIEHVPEQAYEVEIGKAKVVKQGCDLTIVAISYMVLEAMKAAEALKQLGIQVEVIDPISLSPLDGETIINSAVKTGHLLVVDNAWLSCGASAEILAMVAESGQLIKCQRLGFAESTCPTTPSLELEFYPNRQKIISKALSMLGKEKLLDNSDDIDLTRSHLESQFRGPF